MDETFDLLTMALLPDIGPRAIRELAARDRLGTILTHPEGHADLLPARARNALRSGAARRQAEAERQQALGMGIQIVGWDERDYPMYLREIYDPPPVLYVRGPLRADEGERTVAIVGSRAASPQGLSLVRALARDLASVGVTVVSGLARGIDAAAHQGALDAQGRTVAVFGSGLDRVYPKENGALAESIAKDGALVSEFPLGTEPYPGHFPRRNRIIAGWGRAVVVVEAAERSGALGTARAALEEGREVLAVPGHPSHPGAAGTNQLIRDGAALVRDAADVAREIGLALTLPDEGRQSGDAILNLVKRDAPISLDELHERSGRPVPELLTRLAQLEVSDKVRRLPGALFVRN